MPPKKTATKPKGKAPAYVDVAVKRWEQFTGKKAVLEGAEDGRA